MRLVAVWVVVGVGRSVPLNTLGAGVVVVVRFFFLGFRGAGLVAGQVFQIEHWYEVGLVRSQLRAVANRLKGVIRMEAEVVLLVELWSSILFLVVFLLLLFEELLDAHSVDLLQLLLVDVLHWISFVLQEVNQIHDLLLPQLEVVDLVIHLAADFVQLAVLLHQLLDVVEHLLLLLVGLFLRLLGD